MVLEYKKLCSLLCSELLKPNEYQLGHSKMFARQNAMDRFHLSMEDLRYVRVIPIQAAARRWICLLRLKSQKRSVLLLQSVYRMLLKRREFQRLVVEIRRQREVERLRLLEVARQQSDLVENERMRVEAEIQIQLAIEAEEKAQIQRKLDLEPNSIPSITPNRVNFSTDFKEGTISTINSLIDERLPSESTVAISLFEDRIMQLHDHCISGDLKALQEHLKAHPGDYIATNSHSNHCTLLHSAALGGHAAIIEFLSPALVDIIAVLDNHGNNMLHYAASSMNTAANKIAVLRQLLSILENLNSSDTASVTSRASSRISFRFSSSPSSLISCAAFLERVKAVEEALDAAAQNMMLKTVKRSSLYNTSLNANSTPSLVNGVLKAGWLSKR